jgi:hypothetical protein
MFPLTDRQFQCCHKQHLVRVNNPGTRAVEAAGEMLTVAEQIVLPQARHFTTLVCRWAGGTAIPFVLPLVLETPNWEIVRHFGAAIAALEMHQDRLEALRCIQQVHGLVDSNPYNFG